jgi:hypothetical protein
VAAKFDTHLAKYEMSYAPGVHAGSESTTGLLPRVVNVMRTPTRRCTACVESNVTS